VNGYTDIQSRVLVVDGVSYTAPRIRQLVLERYQLAEEVTGLRTRLRQNDEHLRRRTAALIRLIAQKGPVL